MPAVDPTNPNVTIAETQMVAQPKTSADAIDWLHSRTALSRMALSEMTAAFERLEAETGFSLAKSK